MTEYDKTVPALPLADETFFSGANTRDGFKNLFGDFFDEENLTALYIIKGGPGTGKSTFMKKLAAAAKEQGCAVCACLCGSDPDSLDAVTATLNGRSIAIIDGTSPHAYDARFPGAVSRILDFGAFWDEKKLIPERDRIIPLATAKTGCYTRAYRYLHALSVIRSDICEISKKALDTEKMTSACDRLAASFIKFSEHSPAIRNRTFEGTTMKGICAIDFAPGTSLISVTDAEWTYPHLMEALSASLLSKGISHTVLRDSTEPELIRGLFIDKANVRILPFSKKPENAYKNINMTRFLSAEKLRNSRNKRSFARKCALAVADGARESLAEASKYHFELEEIYKTAMDFESLTAKTAEWTEEILARLH